MKKSNIIVILLFGAFSFAAIYYYMKWQSRDFSKVQTIELKLYGTDKTGNSAAYFFQANHVAYNLHYTMQLKNEKLVYEKKLSHDKYVKLLKMLYAESTTKDTTASNAHLISADTIFYLNIDNPSDYISFLLGE